MSAPAVSFEAETKVQETADDAAVSKLSAVRMGYFNDQFLGFFVRRTTAKRSPLINRGYFARMAALDLIIRRFLAAAARTGTGKSQLVSLGAGLDTTFFRLWLDGAAPTTFFEVDFPDISARKAAIYRRSPLLLKALAGGTLTHEEVAEAARTADADAVHASSGGAAGSPRVSGRGAASGRAGGATAAAASAGGSSSSSSSSASAAPATASTTVDGVTFTPNAVGGCDVSGPRYRFLTADLRDVASLQAVLRAGGIDTSVPTLFLSECVLVYLQPEDSCAIIAWAAHAFPRSVFVTYEQIRPHDAFGHMMARNLAERGYTLRGLHAFPDIPAQTARYKELGYTGVTVADMNDIYYRVLPRVMVSRVERLELFDEVEEWHLMSAHYCIAVAVNDALGDVEKGGLGGGLPGIGSLVTATTTATHAATPAEAAANASVSHASGMVADILPEARRHPSSAGAAAASSGSSGSVMSTLSPHEIASQVVKSHEKDAATAASGRARAMSDVSTASASSTPSVHGVSAAAGSSGSFSAAATGGVVNVPAGDVAPALLAAIAAATGTEVESVDLTPTAVTPLPAGTAAAGGSFAAGGSAGGATADGAAPGIECIHTHAGDVVLTNTMGGVDFGAIAEAEKEMTHARHVREQAGLEALRATASRVAAAAAAAMAPGGGKVAATAVGASARAARATGAAAPGTGITYDVESVTAATVPVNLFACLFPVELWKAPTTGAKAASFSPFSA